MYLEQTLYPIGLASTSIAIGWLLYSLSEPIFGRLLVVVGIFSSPQSKVLSVGTNPCSVVNTDTSNHDLLLLAPLSVSNENALRSTRSKLTRQNCD